MARQMQLVGLGPDGEQEGGDRLTLMELIGEGGFGAVYRGRWRNMDVAVKVGFSSHDRQWSSCMLPARKALPHWGHTTLATPCLHRSTLPLFPLI